MIKTEEMKEKKKSDNQFDNEADKLQSGGNTSIDYSLLSREELIQLLQQKEQSEYVPPNDWHSLMYALLHIVLYHYDIEIKREFTLGAQPPRADFVVVDEREVIDLNLKIFKVFRKTNIIEFKSPDDELSEAVLWKTIGYAGLYIAKYGTLASDITLTIIRDTKPVKLLNLLNDYIKAYDDGIYYIRNWKVDFPIQIIVTSALKGEEYAGFRAISKKPQVEDIIQLTNAAKAAKETKDSNLLGWFRDYLDLFSRLDDDLVEEAKRRNSNMARSWRDIFGVDNEINAAVNAAVDNNTRSIYFSLVRDGDLTLDRAARRTNMSTDDFITAMREAGFMVPTG